MQKILFLLEFEIFAVLYLSSFPDARQNHIESAMGLKKKTLQLTGLGIMNKFSFIFLSVRQTK